MRKHPNEFWIMPWSVGYECRTSKPDVFSIHVVDAKRYNELQAGLVEISLNTKCKETEKLADEILNEVRSGNIKTKE